MAHVIAVSFVSQGTTAAVHSAGFSALLQFTALGLRADDLGFKFRVRV